LDPFKYIILLQKLISENWLVVMQIRQRTDSLEHRIVSELIRWWHRNYHSAAKTDSVQTPPFGDKNWFAADNTIRQRKPDSLQTTQFDRENLICCRHHNSTANTWFAIDNTIQQRTLIHCRHHHSATNTDLLKITQFNNETSTCVLVPAHSFFIRIHHNHIISSMNNYMQFSSST
jgi:hypothetical protein